MSPEHIDNLLQEAVDGELTADRRAELDRLLAAQPALAERLRRLERLDRALAALPSQEPPPGLVGDILAALPPTAAPRVRTLRPAPPPATRRNLMALAAGLGVLAVALVVEQGTGPAPSASDAIGTLLATPPAATVPAAGQLLLSLEPLRGSIQAQARAGGIAVDLDLVATGEVLLTVAPGAGEVRRSIGPGLLRETLQIAADPAAPLRVTVATPGQSAQEFVIARVAPGE